MTTTRWIVLLSWTLATGCIIGEKVGDNVEPDDGGDVMDDDDDMGSTDGSSEEGATSDEPQPGTETGDSTSDSAGESTGDSTGGDMLVPCEERTEDECVGPVGELGPDGPISVCDWVAELSTVPADACEPVSTGACLQFPTVFPPGCSVSLTCEGPGTESVFYREHADGTIDILPADYCGNEPAGFARCGWAFGGPDNPPGPLEEGPAACDCAC